MSKIKFTVDGKACIGTPGQTIMEAALANGVYIPALCRYEGLKPAGSCRICTVRVGGRPMAACTQPVSEGMAVENMSQELEDMRKALVEMLFVEGNHMCPTCEKSGNCELQALAYRYQMLVPRFPYQFPARSVEPTGGRLLFEYNRCIQCLRCVRSVKTKDGKAVFGPLGRSEKKKIGMDKELASKLSDKDAREAMDRCPVGALLKKEVGFVIPIGKRKFDKTPIGSDVGKTAS
ncbi:MAG: 2Fe-2S iron-sulfur cluster-binding protein [Candidatus Aminicenantes bacterium]|nr:2Fe-2S iron-sulfur cluster-binding protein [Candidatus Aminicenantes bacterium]